MTRLITWILAYLARQVIAKYRPKIIGVTGSTGKTSARRAIFFALKEHFRVYTPEKNLNTTIGLPLGVLLSDSPGRSFAGWLRVFIKGCELVIFPHRYPEVLVLEYGIDRPGEMDQLIAIAKPDIAVLTAIGVSHLENFESEQQLADEKVKLLEAVEDSGVIFVNLDDLGAAGEVTKRQAAGDMRQVIRYSGYDHPEAEVHADDIHQDLEAFQSTTFVKTPKSIINVSISAVGKAHISAALVAVAVAESLGVPGEMIKKGLINYHPEPGRLNIITGSQKTVIIDDTYNSAPKSTEIALELLADFLLEGDKKMIVLGDMLELGSEAEEMHRQVGRMVASMNAGYLVTVGNLAKLIGDEAVQAGMNKERYEHFNTSNEAKRRVLDLLSGYKVILVKGSQGMRMERIVKEIMAEPMRAGDLLCRQDASWLQKN